MKLSPNKKNSRSWILPASIVLAALIVATSLVAFALVQKNSSQDKNLAQSQKSQTTTQTTVSQQQVIPSDGVKLPIVWGDLGKQLVQAGVIDQQKFESLYDRRGGLSEQEQVLLDGNTQQPLHLTSQNAQTILNLAWAFGLANKNPILEQGPMMNDEYGGAGRFASTGGWTLAQGDAMNHYSKHEFITLNQKQQALVEEVSRNIYRPCCGNSTHFPDCNHGMAMLGLLELMAHQGANESEMYAAALQLNSYWFPSNYMTIAKLYAKNGTSWDKVNPREVLSANYSSSAGYRQVLSKVEPAKLQGGNGCGV